MLKAGGALKRNSYSLNDLSALDKVNVKERKSSADSAGANFSDLSADSSSVDSPGPTARRGLPSMQPLGMESMQSAVNAVGADSVMLPPPLQSRGASSGEACVGRSNSSASACTIAFPKFEGRPELGHYVEILGGTQLSNSYLGQRGVICADDRGSIPYRVLLDSGETTDWLIPREIVSSGMSSAALIRWGGRRPQSSSRAPPAMVQASMGVAPPPPPVVVVSSSGGTGVAPPLPKVQSSPMVQSSPGVPLPLHPVMGQSSPGVDMPPPLQGTPPHRRFKPGGSMSERAAALLAIRSPGGAPQFIASPRSASGPPEVLGR